MAIRHYLETSTPGTFAEVSDRVQRVSWETGELGEEGSTGAWTVTIADPAMDFNTLGWRQYVIEEDASDITDTVVAAGFVQEQTISDGDGTDFYEPDGRVWDLAVADMNTAWGLRLMAGFHTKRPRERDTVRMAWLLGTSMAAIFDDVTTYVDAPGSSGEAWMDAVDTRGMSFAQIVSDCSQESGRNWFCWTQRTDATHRKLIAWYALESRTTRTSLLSLSTDAAAIDGAATFAVAPGAKLVRKPDRVYSGALYTYKNGSGYRRRAATETAFGGTRRDMAISMPTVSSATVAATRARRQLNAISTQELRISCATNVPREKAAGIRVGMRVPYQNFRHPAFETSRYCRVVSCQARPVGAGERYDLGLELVPQPPQPCSPGLVQSKTGDASVDIVFDSPVTSGDLLVVCSSQVGAVLPTGWTLDVQSATPTTGSHAVLYHKVAGASEPASYHFEFPSGVGNTHWIAAEYGCTWAGATIATRALGGQTRPDENPVHDTMAVTTTGDYTSLMLVGFLDENVFDMTADSGWTLVGQGAPNAHSRIVLVSRIGAGAFTAGVGYGALAYGAEWTAASLVFNR